MTKVFLCKQCSAPADFPEENPQWCGECYTKDPDHQFDDYIDSLQYHDDAFIDMYRDIYEDAF
jgi:hypothetical protein